MLDGIVEGLIVAWILSAFNVDNIVIDVFQPFTDVHITTNHYYVACALIGLLNSLLNNR